MSVSCGLVARCTGFKRHSFSCKVSEISNKHDTNLKQKTGEQANKGYVFCAAGRMSDARGFKVLD